MILTRALECCLQARPVEVNGLRIALSERLEAEMLLGSPRFDTVVRFLEILSVNTIPKRCAAVEV